MHEIIRDMRRHCRLAMNGVVSTSMRQRGIAYKVNFGLTIQQIKDLAKHYTPGGELAEALWKEDTRELKILATLLYPTEKFTSENARQWLTAIHNQEIREQVCFNLFQNLPFAAVLVTDWCKNENEETRITGYWLLARLLLSKKSIHIDLDDFHYIWGDIYSGNSFLRNAGLLALKHIGRQSKELSSSILIKLVSYKDSSDIIKKEAYDSLAFEFEYYFS